MRENAFLGILSRGGACRCAAVVIALVLLPGGAHAASVDELLAAGTAHIEDFAYDQAVEAFKQAQIDAPHEYGIPYAIGCALFAKAESLSGQDLEGAKAAYAAARETFQRIVDVTAGNDALREEARFGVATCIARAAEVEANPEEYLQNEDKNSVSSEDFKKRVNLLREGANALDQFVATHPNDARARQNADRLRYFWKKMLQERPKPKYGVTIIKADTDFPHGSAQPLPDEASVELHLGSQESGL